MASGVANSTDLALFVDGVKIAYATDATFSLNAETRDVTTKDSVGWRETCPGLKSASASANALYASTVTTGASFDDLFQKFKTTATNDVVVALSNDGTVVYSGKAIITSLEINSPGAEENVTYSISLEINGSVPPPV